jgi:hypothetical protein
MKLFNQNIPFLSLNKIFYVLSQSQWSFSCNCLLLLCLILRVAPLKADEATFKLESESVSVLKGTNIDLIVEKGVEATNNEVGDLFVSRVYSSAYSSDKKTLLIPKGSWVTGRVVSVQHPSRFSKAGKLSLELDALTTLTGDYLPLNATISFESGKVNQAGMLDPQTGFKDKALESTKKLLASNTGQIVSIATLGIPVVVTLIGGSAKAIISKGDSIGLLPGENFQIQLRDDSLMLK